MKKLITTLLLVTVILFSVGCSKKITKEELVGEWKCSYEYNGNHFDATYNFYDDNSWFSVYFKNGVYDSVSIGMYTIEDGDLLVYEGSVGQGGYMRFTGTSKGIENNKHVFVKQ